MTEYTCVAENGYPDERSHRFEFQEVPGTSPRCPVCGRLQNIPVAWLNASQVTSVQPGPVVPEPPVVTRNMPQPAGALVEEEPQLEVVETPEPEPAPAPKKTRKRKPQA